MTPASTQPRRASQSWANVILFYSEDESKALDRFFELLDEFIARHSSVDALGEDGLEIEEKVEVFRS